MIVWNLPLAPRRQAACSIAKLHSRNALRMERLGSEPSFTWTLISARRANCACTAESRCRCCTWTLGILHAQQRLRLVAVRRYIEITTPIADDPYPNTLPPCIFGLHQAHDSPANCCMLLFTISSWKRAGRSLARDAPCSAVTSGHQDEVILYMIASKHHHRRFLQNN